jgi:CheY-like chemotaxis protein
MVADIHGSPPLLLPVERIARQVRGIDTWTTARRLREELLTGAGVSRDEQMARARRLDVLRRTQAAIIETTARRLAQEPSQVWSTTPTVVVAHRHPWFLDRVCTLLAGQGVEVVTRTDNGADALGAVVAEQPDLLLVGDRLAMMTCADLLSEAALFSPRTARVAQTEHEDDVVAAVADAVFARRIPPADVVDHLARLVAASGDPAA